MARGKLGGYFVCRCKTATGDRFAPNPLLTVHEASAFLQITPRTIHRLVREGLLGCVQITSRERCFTARQLDAYIEAQTIPAKIAIDRKPGTRYR